MYTQEKDPMIIPFDPDNSGDNRASAIMAILLVVLGSILMAISLWAFLPNSTSTHDQSMAPIHRGLPLGSSPHTGTSLSMGKPRVVSGN
jgi:hypothetical protein